MPDIFDYEIAAILRKSLVSTILRRQQHNTALDVLRDVTIETHVMRVDVESLCKQAERFWLPGSPLISLE